jgi:hypothetical protein
MSDLDNRRKRAVLMKISALARLAVAEAKLSGVKR